MDRRVLTDGVCTSCNQDAATSHIDCIKCKASIHVIGCTAGPDLCTETMCNSWAGWQRKYTNVQFICNQCMESITSTSSVSEKVAEMEQKLLTVNQEFLVFKQSLQGETAEVKPARLPTQATNSNKDENRGSNSADPAAKYGFKTLQAGDVGRAKKLFNQLKYSDVRKAKTVIIMDSNGNGIKDRQLDPEGDCKVITAGGLCIVGAVHGLLQYKRTHTNIKKLVYVIGTNDQLHPEQHTPSERVDYIKALHAESTRVFPNSQINIVLPFGGTKIDSTAIDGLSKAIVDADVGMKQYRGPNMRYKLAEDNLHLNEEGKTSFREFLRSRFIPRKPKPFSAASGMPRNGAESKIYSENSMQPTNPTTNLFSGQGDQRMQAKPPPPSAYYSYPPPPTYQQVQPSLVREITDAVAKIMSSSQGGQSGQIYQRSPQPYGQWVY